MLSNTAKCGLVCLLLGAFGAAKTYAQSPQRPAINGSSEAPLKIDFYFSYACPHCLEIVSDTQEAVDRAVKSNSLQIRYYEIPQFFTVSTKDYLENVDQASQRSTYLSLVMQCFIHSGRADGFGRAHGVVSDLLKQVVGSSRTLPPSGAPDEYADWQYWVWADQISNMSAQILQPLINTAGVDVRACDQSAVSKVFNARYEQLPVQAGQRDPEIPQMKINGEWVPGGNGNVPRLKTFLSHSGKISKILGAEIAFDTMQISNAPLLADHSVERANSSISSLVIKSGSVTYYVSFGPDEIEIKTNQAVVSTFPPAPLLDFLFFGRSVSAIAAIADAPDSGDWDVVAITDVKGNALLVEMKAGAIHAFSYQAVDDDGFSFAMNSDGRPDQ